MTALVRSYDFQPSPDRGECYLEGERLTYNEALQADPELTAHASREHHVFFRVTRAVWLGKPESNNPMLGQVAAAPLQGRMIPEFPNRVTIIQELSQ